MRLSDLSQTDLRDLEAQWYAQNARRFEESLSPADASPNSVNAAKSLRRRLETESWREFERAAGTHVPMLIDGLWREGALGFVGAMPKAGKTWLGIELAVSVVTGTPAFGSFAVPHRRPVLYVALEGHRSALRTRTGCVARGHGVRPERDGLDLLHWAYKPRGLDLAEPAWAAALTQRAVELEAGLVVVDVLRRAARFKENESSSFMELATLLEPLDGEHGVSVAILHHFVKTSETSRERVPGERLAGSGSMFGAYDVGLFITKSEASARRLTIHADMRDGAAPDGFIVTLQGEGSGPHGGFAYSDSLRLVREDLPSREENLKAPPNAIRDWLIEQGGQATPGEIKSHFKIADQTLRDRRERLQELGVLYCDRGRSTVYEATGVADSANPALPRDTTRCGVGEPVPAHPAPLRGGAGESRDDDGLAHAAWRDVDDNLLDDQWLHDLDATEAARAAEAT